MTSNHTTRRAAHSVGGGRTVRLRGRLATAALLGVGLTIAATAPAYAGHGKDGIDPDNTNQSFRKHTLTTKGNTAVNAADAQLEKSVITTSWTTGDADVAIYDNDYNQNDWNGEVYCTDWNHNAIGFPTTCDDMTILLDTHNLGPYAQWMWTSTACQEFGHSGDLGHRQAANDSDDNSCMRNDGDQPSFIYLDAHDVDAISETF